MKTFQINKLYAIAKPDGCMIIACKRFMDEIHFGENAWTDVECKHFSKNMMSEVSLKATQLGDKSLDNFLVMKDSEGNEYQAIYRNERLTKRLFCVILSKFFGHLLTKDEFNAKTSGKFNNLLDF